MSDTRLKLIEAIARQKAIEASYNGKRIKLAPHLLFERRGDLFVSALNMSKNWRSQDERRLGQFKLTGLGAPDLLEESFDPLPSYDPAALQGDDKLLLAI
ncbi:MAG: WYL domain-containing protein [Pseudomonadota bacterium]|nr:WYL domain-containing protein [Pseudomonadota bacterium]